MPTLIACLSSGKGTWTEVTKIIQSQQWDKIFLITNSFGQEKFTLKQPNIHLIIVDPFQEPVALTEQIKTQLNDKITDFEIALNFASGSGKEHISLLEAIIELGLNFRLITLNNNHIQVMGMGR